MSEIQTFIFMDLETTGLIDNHNLDPLMKRWEPGDTNRNNEAMLRSFFNFADDPATMPHITEMSFISVPRQLLLNGAEKMLSKHSAHDFDVVNQTGCANESPLTISVAGNVHTRQLNPDISEERWAAYEAMKRSPESNPLHKNELLTKRTFAEEWPGVHHLLRLAPKPACLIAHNGLRFDFRIVLNELRRNYATLKHYPIPDDVYFADSYLAFLDLEKEYHNSIKLTTNGVNWRIVTELVLKSTAVNAHNDNVSLIPNPSLVCAPTKDPTSKQTDPVTPPPQAPVVAFNEAQPRNKNAGFISRALLRPNDITHTTPTKRTVSDGAAVIAQSREGDNQRNKAKRTLFQEAHPLRFMKREDWSPAKRRRLDSNIFERSNEGDWRFSDVLGDKYFYSNGNFKLGNIYKQIIGGTFNAHRAQADTEALMQVCMGYGREFVTYVDTYRAPFPTLNAEQSLNIIIQRNCLRGMQTEQALATGAADVVLVEDSDEMGCGNQSEQRVEEPVDRQRRREPKEEYDSVNDDLRLALSNTRSAGHES
ncbi:hypothetical protein Ddc_08464 [Ditylenchus destructor]|nr:hypothetical protein Ddc_08464 [Ditylenchus destructor]